MKKKELTIQKRVDLLIKHGVDQPQKWMSIHGYDEPSQSLLEDAWCRECVWGDEWKRLRSHHLAETGILFEIITELCRRVEDQQWELNNTY